MNKKAAGSWLVLAIAVLSWAGAAYFLIVVLQMQSERATYTTEVAQASMQEGQAAQLRALARETEQDRASFAQVTNVDVLTAVNLIESVNASGTPVHVTSAQPIKSGGKSGAQQVNAIDLSAHAEGPFSALMHAAQMLETLPITTSVQEIDITHVPYDKTTKSDLSPWSLNIRLRFYTTAALSS